MTVEELIDYLQQLDPKARVVVDENEAAPGVVVLTQSLLDEEPE